MALERYMEIFKKKGLIPIKVNTKYDLPYAPGVYLLTEMVGENEIIRYIGSTNVLKTRLYSHHILRKLEKARVQIGIYMIPHSAQYMRTVEARLIFKIQPLLNSQLKSRVISEQMDIVRKFKPNKFEIIRVDIKKYLTSSQLSRYYKSQAAL